MCVCPWLSPKGDLRCLLHFSAITNYGPLLSVVFALGGQMNLSGRHGTLPWHFGLLLLGAVKKTGKVNESQQENTRRVSGKRKKSRNRRSSLVDRRLSASPRPVSASLANWLPHQTLNFLLCLKLTGSVHFLAHFSHKKCAFNYTKQPPESKLKQLCPKLTDERIQNLMGETWRREWCGKWSNYQVGNLIPNGTKNKATADKHSAPVDKTEF